MAVDISIPLTFSKSTVGKHIYANPDMGFSGVYVPKEMFPKGKDLPKVLFLHLSEEE